MSRGKGRDLYSNSSCKGRWGESQKLSGLINSLMSWMDRNGGQYFLVYFFKFVDKK